MGRAKKQINYSLASEEVSLIHLILTILSINFRTTFAFFLKQHHSVDILSLRPSTIPHSSFALLLPTSYPSFSVSHLISSLSAFDITELCLTDLRPLLQLIKIIWNFSLPLKGFRSSFRLLPYRSFIKHTNYAWNSLQGWKDEHLLNPIWNGYPFWQQTTDRSILSMLLWTVLQCISIFTSFNC